MTLDINRAIFSVTLAGSVLSFFATTSVLISFTVYRHHIRTFRHMLILELMLFEFANNLNNSTSGIWHLINGELSPGKKCVVNGFIGQFSAQGVDLSILAIAVVTLFTVTGHIYMPAVSMARRICVCLSICIIPLITSVIPTLMDEMKPVGGNWCWISSNRADLRYSMAHGWRICVIFGTVAIYIYIWIYLKRKLRRETPGSNRVAGFSFTRSKRKGFQNMDDDGLELDAFGRSERNARAAKAAALEQTPLSPRHTGFEELDAELGKRPEVGPSAPKGGVIRHRPTSSKVGIDSMILESLNDIPAQGSGARQSQHMELPQVNILQTNGSEFGMRPSNRQVQLEIKRMLLLNAYPYMYVLLWGPGLVNRLMEASGNPNSLTINAALQAPTQFIGLANALTYGFNHYLRDRLNDLYWRPMITRIKNRIGLY